MRFLIQLVLGQLYGRIGLGWALWACGKIQATLTTSPINNICDGSTTIIALLPHQHYHVICHIILCSMKIAMSTPSATSVSVHVTQSDLTVLDLSPICNQKPWLNHYSKLLIVGLILTLGKLNFYFYFLLWLI